MSLVPFDDRDGWIWMDGELVPWREAKVHVLTHALHYASCVFEGERMYDGEIFELTQHNERLFKSAGILDFQIPFTVAEIDEACKQTAARNGLENCYVRPLAWRGPEQMGVSAQATRTHVAIATWPWGAYYDAAQLRKGIRLTYAKYKRPSPETAPTSAKAAGLYMICTISKHAAEKEGYSDALMLDYRGYVAETTSANIFLVRDGQIHTPKPDCFLDGITRRSVIGLAQKLGFDVVERHIPGEELGTFSEVFVTGTAAEVTPVAEIGEHRYTPGNITFALMDDFQKMVRRQPVAA
jgi:branched-chain amino acid aminotransferase